MTTGSKYKQSLSYIRHGTTRRDRCHTEMYDVSLNVIKDILLNNGYTTLICWACEL